ncbi:hypothetical protein VCSRO161_2416 [Vibrio cholerae]|nr:hypothetical protein VCSRO161_2416 [Vibrio cholerae]
MKGNFPPAGSVVLAKPLSEGLTDLALDKLDRTLIKQKWTPTVGHISSFLKWLTQLMLRIFAYRSRPHQE